MVRTEFRGAPVLFLGRALAATLVLAALTCFALLGKAWANLLVFSLLFLAPVVACLAVGIYWLDRLVLDDVERCLRTPLRGRLSYDAVERFEIQKAAGLLTLGVKPKGKRTRPLLLSADVEEEPAIRRSLGERWPDAAIADTQMRMWLGVAAPLAVMAAAYLGLLVYLYRTQPYLEVRCEPAAEWFGGSTLPGGRVEEFRGVSFRLPNGFHPRGAGSAEGSLEFEDSAGTSITVGPSPFEAGLENLDDDKAVLWPKDWFQQSLGVKNSYDLTRLAYCARFGVVPLLLKAVALRRFAEAARADLELFEAEGEGWRALILVAGTEEQGFAEIVVRSDPAAEEIVFTIRSDGDVEKPLLRTLLKAAR